MAQLKSRVAPDSGTVAAFAIWRHYFLIATPTLNDIQPTLNCQAHAKRHGILAGDIGNSAAGCQHVLTDTISAHGPKISYKEKKKQRRRMKNTKQLEKYMESHNIYPEMSSMSCTSYSENVYSIFEFFSCTLKLRLIDVSNAMWNLHSNGLWHRKLLNRIFHISTYGEVARNKVEASGVPRMGLNSPVGAWNVICTWRFIFPWEWSERPSWLICYSEYCQLKFNEFPCCFQVDFFFKYRNFCQPKLIYFVWRVSFVLYFIVVPLHVIKLHLQLK
jgi:hypothetical protein